MHHSPPAFWLLSFLSPTFQFSLSNFSILFLPFMISGFHDRLMGWGDMVMVMVMDGILSSKDADFFHGYSNGGSL